jgi:hypothetical protein
MDRRFELVSSLFVVDVAIVAVTCTGLVSCSYSSNSCISLCCMTVNLNSLIV